MRFETLTGDEVNALIRGESLERAGVSDLLDDAIPGKEVGTARPVTVDPKTKPETDASGPGPVPQPS